MKDQQFLNLSNPIYPDPILAVNPTSKPTSISASETTDKKNEQDSRQSGELKMTFQEIVETNQGCSHQTWGFKVVQNQPRSHWNIIYKPQIELNIVEQLNLSIISHGDSL